MKLLPYGTRIHFVRGRTKEVGRVFSVGFMFNGWYFSFYKSCTTGKLEFAHWANIWRKTKRPLPPKYNSR